jgi:hypothetical protein
VKLLNSRKKKAAVAVAAAAVVLAGAGGAYAYFTSTGSGDGSASVGSASTWTVSVGTPNGGPLLPGSGAETLSYTITNPGTGHQNLNSTSATVKADGSGNVYSGTSPVAGCKASWFNAANSAPAAADLAGGGTATGSVTVTMANAAESQDACQNVQPVITVSAN